LLGIGLGLAAERREVVLTDQGADRGPHQRQIERLVHVPRHVGDQRVGRRVVPHVIPVTPPGCREAGAEVGVDPVGAADRDCRRTQLVDPAGEVVEVGGFGQVARHDLSPRVDPGIGAPGAGQLDRLAHDEGDRLGQRRHHRR
jgi:hypothetical protein